MKCWLCPRPIAKADAPKRVEWRRGTGGEVLYGADQAPLSEARGALVKAAHGKCYWARVNRDKRREGKP